MIRGSDVPQRAEPHQCEVCTHERISPLRPAHGANVHGMHVTVFLLEVHGVLETRQSHAIVVFGSARHIGYNKLTVKYRRRRDCHTK